MRTRVVVVKTSAERAVYLNRSTWGAIARTTTRAISAIVVPRAPASSMVNS